MPNSPSFSQPAPVGIRLTAVPLFCEACRYTFYVLIPGTLTRVNRVLQITEKDSPPRLWDKPVCPECGSSALWLWELI